MPVKIDTTVTVMDMVAISGVVISGAFFIFSYGGSIDANSQEIEHNADSIARIERQGERHEQKMVKLIEKNTVAVDKARIEAKENYKDVAKKLDKIIDRALDGK